MAILKVPPENRQIGEYLRRWLMNPIRHGVISNVTISSNKLLISVIFCIFKDLVLHI